MRSELFQRLLGKRSQLEGDDENSLGGQSSRSSMTLVVGNADYVKLADGKKTGKNESDEDIVFDGDSPVEHTRNEKSARKHRANHPPQPFVQLCPHQQLSFERLNRIVGLPEFKESGKPVDFITAGQYFHSQRVPTDDGSFACQPNTNSKNGFWGWGSYTYRQNHLFAESGLELSFHWWIRLRNDSGVPYTLLQLQAWLGSANVWLCPHTKLSDAEVVEKILSLIEPKYKAPDPVEAYEKIHPFNGEGKKCAQCHSTIRIFGSKLCQIDVTRFFGKGSSVHGRQWLAQCGVDKR